MPKRRADKTLKDVKSTRRGTETSCEPVEPTQTYPTKPACLSGRSSEIWDEFAPDLIAHGMLTSADTLMFAVWCSLASKIEEGDLKPALVTQFRLIGNDFGLSPSGKGREQRAPSAPPKKPSRFFGD